MKMNGSVGWVAAALLAVGAAACGNVTAGGLVGEATVVVSGDADTLALAPPAPAALAMVSAPSRSPGEEEGQVEVEFLAYLVTEGGSALQLGNGEIQVQVDLRGRTEMDVVDRQKIPVGLYTEFRLIFTEISAEVENLIIDGMPVSQVHVELEDLSLLVSRAIDLDVADGSTAELVVDLNSLAWLDAVDPLTGAVDQTVFQDLVHVAIR